AGRVSESVNSCATSAARVDSALAGRNAAASLVWTLLSRPCAWPPKAPMAIQRPMTATMTSPRRNPLVLLLSMLRNGAMVLGGLHGGVLTERQHRAVRRPGRRRPRALGPPGVGDRSPAVRRRAPDRAGVERPPRPVGPQPRRLPRAHAPARRAAVAARPRRRVGCDRADDEPDRGPARA